MDFISADNTVSIHASVKDATSLRNFIMFRSFVSIHASVKDATSLSFILFKNESFVSIHASVKDATFNLSYTGDSHAVSIHASVKDATCGAHYGYSHGYGFNPRICKRCDKYTKWALANRAFQSTHL